MEPVADSSPLWLQVVAVLALVLSIVASYTNFRGSLATAARDIRAASRWSMARSKNAWRAFPLSSAAREERHSTQEQREREMALQGSREDLHCSVLRVVDIRRRQDRYFPSELRMQTRACKETAIRFASLFGTHITDSRCSAATIWMNYPDGGIWLEFGLLETSSVRLAVSVGWYPNRRLGRFSPYDTETKRDRTSVLEEPLTEEEMTCLGWQVPDGWSPGWSWQSIAPQLGADSQAPE